MTSKILFIDDDVNLLDAVQRALRKQFTIDRAVGGAEGLQKLDADGPYAVVVADMQMPQMSGLEFLRKVRVKAPDTVRIMLTGNGDQKTAIDAVNDGRVFRFLNKPCPPPTLVPVLEAGLERFRLVCAERELLQNTLGGAVNVLTEILAASDPAAYDRGQRLKGYVADFAGSLNESSWELELAAMLCQIGRVTIPASVLAKQGAGLALTAAESSMWQRVPEFGAKIIENIPRLSNVAAIVRAQQRHFDGSGPPADGPAGQEIPVGARILKILSDLVDLEAKSFSKAAALHEMQQRIGWYDPEALISAFRWCDFAPAPALDGRSAPQVLKVEELRTGCVLAEDLRTRDGLLLVARETRLTPMLLARLVNFRKLDTIEQTLLVHLDSAEI